MSYEVLKRRSPFVIQGAIISIIAVIITDDTFKIFLIIVLGNLPATFFTDYLIKKFGGEKNGRL